MSSCVRVDATTDSSESDDWEEEEGEDPFKRDKNWRGSFSLIIQQQTE